MSLFILPHEWGHAVSAHLLGWRVFKVSLGWGRTLGQFRLAGLLHEINTAPLGGLTWFAPREISWYRTKYILISLAGPCVHAAVLLALLATYPVRELISFDLFKALAPITMLAHANALLLVVNLFPSTWTLRQGSFPMKVYSDGLAILMAPFLSRAAVEQAHASLFAMEGYQCLQDRCYEAARDWHEKGLALYPNDVGNRTCLALALHFLKDFRGAREHWSIPLARTDLRRDTRTMLLINIAWVDLLIGGPELLDEADRLSREALEKESWHPAFQGTRGSVLIELGEAEKGLPMVRKAMEHNDDPRLKALNACYVALGEWRLGHQEESRRHWELARKWDSDCILLGKVRQELGSTQDTTGPHRLTSP